jgi:hypothetical protein
VKDVQTTNNLGLKKPGAEDVVNIEDLNSNSDALDGKFGASSGHGHTGAAGDGPKIGSNGLAAGAATDTVIGSRTVSDATAPTGDSGTPTTLFGWLANMIKAITGGATWRALPGMTIAAIKTILDAATNAGTASTLMKRDGSGRAQVAAPSVAADIARKDTVDAVQSNLNTHAAVGSTAHGATSAPTVSTLMARDSAGRAQVVAPSVAADIANKGYVDSSVSTAQSAANAAQTRANANLPKDGSEPFTGAYFRISNTAPILQMNETDTGKNWYTVADGNYLSIREDNLSTERVAILPGGKMTINANTVWHAGNDGLGSGLDADMVRGKIPLLKDGSETMNGIMEFRTGAADTSGSTGIKGNINGWTRLDPNGNRFLVPVGNSAVNESANWLTVENTDNGWAQMLSMKANGDIYIRGSRVLHQQDYNTLFQYANDGKTAVANAITAKGVSASPSETFAALAGKIGQIVIGKRFASGTGTFDANNVASVFGLSFRPSIIILECYFPNINQRYRFVHYGNTIASPLNGAGYRYDSDTVSVSVYETGYYATISNSSFYVTVRYATTYGATSFNWIAFE